MHHENFYGNGYAIARQLKEMIDVNPFDDRPIKELAAGLNIGRNSLQKTFKQITGKGIVQYRNDARLTSAKEMLRHTGKQVKEIALLCTFRDHHYFSRMFKKKFGLSPANWRAKNATSGAKSTSDLFGG